MATLPSAVRRLIVHRQRLLSFDVCQHSSTPARKHPEIDLTFENTKEAFKSKTTWQLLRGLLVLRLCTVDSLVKHNHALMKTARRALGARLFSVAMKSTFYGHFVAGDTQEEIKPVITNMRKYGVKSILDYSVEKDVGGKEGEAEDWADVPDDVRNTPSSAEQDTQRQYSGYRELWDRREGVSSARTFFYAGEPECDANAQIFIDSVDAVADATEGTGFVAIKLTALGRPSFLIKLSEVIARSQQFYRALTNCTWETIVQQAIGKDEFILKLKELGIKTESKVVRDWFDGLDFDEDGFVDMYEWSRLIDSSFKLGDMFKTLNLQTGKMEPLIASLTEEEEAQFAAMMARVRSIIEHARKRGVRVMIDAEQSYFQPAISRLVLEMMRIYNHDEPVVFNTYQAYLRHALDNVRLDMHLARRENFYFACKLVRGAYMEQERHRAELIGYKDPINGDFEATSTMYDAVLCHVLDEVGDRESGKVSIMCATHNESSVRNAVREMRRRDIHPDDRVVCFGQLYGMCDQISFSLGQAGYSVYKYVPYGPVDEVLPYLSRRAIENSGIIKKAQKERRLMASEVRRRLIGF